MHAANKSSCKLACMWQATSALHASRKADCSGFNMVGRITIALIGRWLNALAAEPYLLRPQRSPLVLICRVVTAAVPSRFASRVKGGAAARALPDARWQHMRTLSSASCMQDKSTCACSAACTAHLAAPCSRQVVSSSSGMLESTIRQKHTIQSALQVLLFPIQRYPERHVSAHMERPLLA